MAVRSRCLVWSASQPATGWNDVWTVPAGRTAIVRRWSIHNASGTARTVQLGVRRGATNLRVASAGVLASGATLAETDADLVLNPGDVLSLFLGSETSSLLCHLHASGSLLDGEPI